MMHMNSMKTVIPFVAIVPVLIFGAVWIYFSGKRYEVVITQEKIDAGLEDRFPASTEFLLIFEITYSNPEVTLLDDDDRVQVGLDATLNVRVDGEEKELGGGATVTTGIRYEPETREFFLDDAEFQRLDIEGIPEKWSDQVKKLAGQAAEKFLERHPVYKLEAKDGKTAVARFLLRDVEVKEQAVYVTLGI